MKYEIENLDALNQFAADFLANLNPNKDEATLVVLSGDLGAGKTALVKACAKILGIDEDITSPTFVIQKEYELQNQSFEKMIHIDAYRLEGSRDLEHLGWNDLVAEARNIIFLEWPEMVSGIKYPPKTYVLEIAITQGEARKIMIQGA